MAAVWIVPVATSPADDRHLIAPVGSLPRRDHRLSLLEEYDLSYCYLCDNTNRNIPIRHQGKAFAGPAFPPRLDHSRAQPLGCTDGAPIMFISIAIQQQAPGRIRATAPDLPGCSLEDAEVASACARLRLAIEGYLADLLLAGEPVPEPRSLVQWRDDAKLAGADWYEMHINIAHIEAVARHQRAAIPLPVRTGSATRRKAPGKTR